jgi:hypothetical protein
MPWRWVGVTADRAIMGRGAGWLGSIAWSLLNFGWAEFQLPYLINVWFPWGIVRWDETARLEREVG